MKALGPKTVNIATLEVAPLVVRNAYRTKKCLKALRTLYYKRVWGGEVMQRPHPCQKRNGEPQGSPDLRMLKMTRVIKTPEADQHLLAN